MVTTTQTKSWRKADVPSCPACGELECLCRPRFFAGQLLSEQDLNRLDRYIIEKNRLHNRSLHGSGVVCGLEVHCHPCADVVTVSPGYALGPCGDDIVVCKADTVDICALIKKCRDKEREDLECRPFAFTPDCKGAEEEWVLAIRYEEYPSRGITALRGGSCSCPPTSCSCGKGSTCGCSKGRACSCGNAKTSYDPVSQRQKRRGAPLECEPTLVCEGYRYEVFRLPPKPDEDARRDPDRKTRFPLRDWLCGLDGPMIERICCCWEAVLDAIPGPPGNFADISVSQHNAWFQWCCAVKQSLTKYFTATPGHNCQVLEQLQAVVCPNPQLGSEAFTQALQQAILRYALIVFEALIDCICSALLPQCPEPAHDPRLPLATVRIRSRDCKVLSVCNWTPLRQFAVTIPTLYYWFSWLPLFRQLREGLHFVCCELFGLRGFGRFDTETFAQPTTGEATDATTGSSPFSTMSFGGAQVGRDKLNLSTFLLQRLQRSAGTLRNDDFIMALLGKRGPDEEIALSDRDAGRAPEFRLLNQLAVPFISGLGPDLLAAIVGPQPDRGPVHAATETEELRTLRGELQAMRDRLSVHEQELQALRERLERNG